MIQKFEFHETEIAGLIEVTPFNADDIRGCFTKDYSKEVFEANGIHHDLAEVFYTTSHKGVIRACTSSASNSSRSWCAVFGAMCGMWWSISARTARPFRVWHLT